MIVSERAHLSVAATSHPGMSGKNNEDRFAVTAYRRGAQDATSVLLAVLADGIGGHRAGEVAAEVAVDTITRVVAASDGAQPADLLQAAIHQASQRILDLASSDSAQMGMGSTCACVLIIDDRLYAASVGDSRVYLMRGDAIRQVTTDHTWIQEAVDNGLIHPDQARSHPNQHVIRRYLGSPLPPIVDLRLRLNPGESDEQMRSNQGFRLLPEDRVLLCSDGLTDLVSDAEILAALNAQPAEPAVDALVDLACQRGGHDNITIIALRMPERPPVPVAKPSRRWPALALGCAALAVLAAALVLGYLGWRALVLPGLGGATATPTPAILLTLPAGAPLPAAATPTWLLPSAPTLPPAATATGPAVTRPAGPTYTPWPTDTPAPGAATPTPTP